ncbi:MAG TPA: hypothetical protein VKR79_08840 [Gaiellaceae bacterium]|nr:hypothetical protein [Gaiellaceae bacterium]
MSRTLMLSLAALACLAVAGAAFGSASHPRIAVRPGRAAPGGPIRVVGSAGDCTGTVTAISAAFPGHAFGEGTLTGTVKANHTFVIRGRLSRDAKPGRYSVGARCGGGNLGVSAYVSVS